MEKRHYSKLTNYMMKGKLNNMSMVENLSEVAMKIITCAGLAKSNYLMALDDAKKGNREAAMKKLQEGSDVYSKAHHIHSSVLSDEMQKLEPQVSLLLVHAEDQLMSAETIKILVQELIEVYQAN